MGVLDRSLQIVSGNPALAALIGQPLHAFVGRPLAEVFGPLPAHVLEAYDQVLQGGSSQKELTFPTSQNPHQLLSTIAYPVAETPAGITGLIATFALAHKDTWQTPEHSCQLAKLGHSLATALTGNDVSRVILEQAGPILGAYGGTLIRVLDKHMLYMEGSFGYGTQVEDTWQPFPTESGYPVVQAVENRDAVFVTVSELPQRFPAIVPLLLPETRAIAVLPLLSEQGVPSVLSLSFRDEQDIAADRRDFMLELAALCARALERARRYDADLLARERATLLANASSLLSASLDVQETLQRITSLAIEHVADWCAVYQPDDTGRICPVVVAHKDAQKEELLRSLLNHFPSDPEIYGTSGWVVRTGESVLIPVIPAAMVESLPTEVHRDAMRNLGFHSLILVPMTVRGRRTGVLGVATTHPSRTFVHDDLELARQLSERAALALDNARRYATVRTGEERYRSLVDATRQTVWTNTPDGRLLGDQPGWARLTGQTREEYEGFGWAAVLHPDDQERSVAAWHQAVASASPYEINQRVRVADGSYRHFHVRVVPALGQDGSVREWTGVHTDITERVRAEQELRDREERYRVLVEYAAVGVARVLPDGRWLDINPAGEALLGYTREELLGRTLLDVTHPDDRGPEGTRPFRRLVAGEVDAFSQEKRYVRKDGQLVWTKVTVSAVRDEAGATQYVVAILNDISEQKKAEDLLRASEERFRQLVGSSPTGIAVGSIDGTLRFPNAAYLEMLGFTLEDFDAGLVNWAALTPPEYRSADENAFRQAFESGVSRPYEKEMLDRYGRRVPVGLVLTRYEQHDETFVVGYVQDLTLHKAAQRTLREHGEELERRVAERTHALEEQRAALDAFVRFTELAAAATGLAELTRHAVDVLRATIGPVSVAYYERHDMLWKAVTWSEDIPEVALAMIRGGVPLDQPSFAQVVQDQQAFYMEEWDAQGEQLGGFRMYGAGALYPFFIDGQAHGLLNMASFSQRTWTPRDKAIFRAVGRSFALALERREQTAQLEAQKAELDMRTQALEQDQGFLRTLLESLTEGIVACDAQGHLTVFNDVTRAFHGLGPEPLPPAAWAERFDLYREDGVTPLPTEEIPLFRAFQGQRVRDQGMVIAPKNGPRRWINANGNPMYSLTGEKLGAVIAMQDVTARRQAEQELQRVNVELQRSNADLEHFAAVASHDLKSPLRTIRSYLELIERRLTGQLDERSMRYMGFATEAAARMDTLIDDLLAYARVGRQRNITRVEPQRVVQEVLGGLTASIQERGAQIRVGDLMPVQADESQLRQVFQNLVGNALKFQPEGRVPEVMIDATRDGRYVLFQVRDNGIGISEEYYERVFALFQQLHGKSEFPGSGLGLAIVRKIIEEHDGRIWLTSVVGEGTTFHFTLPSSDT
ncbi:PAS domain S-box protein [Deinococcus deserti]